MMERFIRSGRGRLQPFFCQTFAYLSSLNRSLRSYHAGNSATRRFVRSIFWSFRTGIILGLCVVEIKVREDSLCDFPSNRHSLLGQTNAV